MNKRKEFGQWLKSNGPGTKGRQDTRMLYALELLSPTNNLEKPFR